MNIRKRIANPEDSHDRDCVRYLVSFRSGHFVTATVLVYAKPDRWDTVQELVAGWCEDNAPGLFCDDYVNGEYARLLASGMTSEDALTAATVDTISLDRGHYFSSEDIGISEGVSREQLAAAMGETS